MNRLVRRVHPSRLLAVRSPSVQLTFRPCASQVDAQRVTEPGPCSFAQTSSSKMSPLQTGTGFPVQNSNPRPPHARSAPRARLNARLAHPPPRGPRPVAGSKKDATPSSRTQIRHSQPGFHDRRPPRQPARRKEPAKPPRKSFVSRSSLYQSKITVRLPQRNTRSSNTSRKARARTICSTSRPACERACAVCV